MSDWGMRREVDLGGELRAWRKHRHVSLRQLAAMLPWDHSTVWKIENGRLPMTREVAEEIDTALETEGALVVAWSATQAALRPAQLPAAAWLVGRDEELAVLSAGVRARPPGTPAVVAIDGPAGVGKTALALRWAHQVAPQYADGQLYADLRGFAPAAQRHQVTVSAVLEQFLTALGVAAVPETMRERTALFRSLTADRKILLVLDNVAAYRDIAPLLPASAGCGVVVTSRRGLSGLVGMVGATRLTLRALTETDAIALVRHVIGDERADVDTEAVTALVRLCGHLPIALHAAAEQIAIYSHRQVAGLVDELAENEHLLCLGAMADLTSVMSWSYHDLDRHAARLFRLLGLHHGPHLSMAAAAALAGITPPQARRSVHQLASLHLIDIDADGLLRLGEVTRAYARELVHTEEADSDRAAAAQRLVSWYVSTAHRARDLATRTSSTTPESTRTRSNAETTSVALEPTAGSATRAETPTVVDGVQPPLDFPDRDSALAWWETELTNFGSVTNLALDYGPPDAAHHLATDLEGMGLLHRSPTHARHTPDPQRQPTPQPSPHASAQATLRERVRSSAREPHRGAQREPAWQTENTPTDTSTETATDTSDGDLATVHRFHKPSVTSNDDAESDDVWCGGVEPVDGEAPWEWWRRRARYRARQQDNDTTPDWTPPWAEVCSYLWNRFRNTLDNPWPDSWASTWTEHGRDSDAGDHARHPDTRYPDDGADTDRDGHTDDRVGHAGDENAEFALVHQRTRHDRGQRGPGRHVGERGDGVEVATG